jgi:anaerobic magnesium-protoporphyrin IX monomethyl ester cyclase
MIARRQQFCDLDITGSRVVLINPQVCDPRAPHLALPALAAYLRARGASVMQLDADIFALLHLLSPLRAQATFEQSCDPRTRLVSRERMALWASAVERVEWAVQALRSDEFFNPLSLHAARNVIDLVLEMSVRSAVGDHLKYCLSPLTFEHAGFDVRKMPDLARLCTVATQFPFKDYVNESLLPSVTDAGPHLACISILNSQQISTGLFIGYTLKRFGFRVVIGGTVFSKFTAALRLNEAFFRLFADFVVVNEGEAALCALLDALATGRFEQVPNLIYLSRGIPKYTFPYVEDVRKLPTPNFHGLPLDAYLAPKLVLPVYFGKGCYFNECKFCDIPSINSISTKAYRVRRVDQVCDDLQDLSTQHGTSYFVITDEALSPTYLHRLADELQRRQLTNFSFVGYSRLEQSITPTLCRKLSEVGFRKLYFGLESGSQSSLNEMNKGIIVDDVPEILKACNDAGLRYHVFSMVGLPSESLEQAKATLSFFKQYRVIIDRPGNTFAIHEFSLDLRTEFYSHASEFGLEILDQPQDDEFAIGLHDREWRRQRGMTHDEVTSFVLRSDDELKAEYQAYHNFPGSFWPMWEEYSVLYCDHFRGEPFPFRTSMHSPSANGLHLRVELSHDTVVEMDGDDVILSSRHARVRIDQQLYELLHGSQTSETEGGGVAKGEAPNLTRHVRAIACQRDRAIATLCSLGLAAVRVVS